jgi:hypothetical protein
VFRDIGSVTVIERNINIISTCTFPYSLTDSGNIRYNTSPSNANEKLVELHDNQCSESHNLRKTGN